MLSLRPRFASVILTFSPLFLHRSWRHAVVLLTGAILTPGGRTVTSILRIAGLARKRRFVNYNRVLNRAAWCRRAASRLLLGLLVAAFAPSGPVVLGIDDTVERRRGKRIPAKGIYRDPVRSSHGHFVKARGLRWLSLMLPAPIPWAGRVLALPFLTALAPSERFCQARERRHKKLTDWERQLVLQARRWLRRRELVVVADSGFAALALLAALGRRGVACVTRLRLDAALYNPAAPRLPGTNGRPRTKGKRLANLSDVLADPATAWQRVIVPGWYGGGERVVEISTNTTVWRHGGMPVVPIRWVLIRDPLGLFALPALLCTNPAQDPVQVLRWFVQRWQLEVTVSEVRDHVWVEMQRQRSSQAIARTMPCRLGLFSLVILLGKQRPTFSDTLAASRREFWREQGSITSRHASDLRRLRPPLGNPITYALCQAA